MARFQARIGLLEVLLGVGLLAVVVRAAQVQLLDGGEYAAEASRSRTEVRSLPARRGTLYDRNGLTLAVTQESYRVGIAPNEVTERAALIRTAAAQLEVSAAELKRRFAAGKSYLYFYGPYTATDVEPLRRFKGCTSRRCTCGPTPRSDWRGGWSAGSAPMERPRPGSSARWIRWSPARRAKRWSSRTAAGAGMSRRAGSGGSRWRGTTWC